MELSRTVDAIAEDLHRAASLASEETARAAELLVASLESTVRLHLLEALHEAARELADSTPGVSVDLRLVGREPVLSLSFEQPPSDDAAGATDAAFDLAGELSRLTVRLPEGLKERLERVASSTGASVNSWIVVALAHALNTPSGQPGPRPSKRMPRRITGFVQG